MKGGLVTYGRKEGILRSTGNGEKDHSATRSLCRIPGSGNTFDAEAGSFGGNSQGHGGAERTWYLTKVHRDTLLGPVKK